MSNCDVTTCFTPEQIAQLLRAINPKRVSQDGKGFSHVEAYDIIAHLNRVFGFGNWSKTFVGGPPALTFEEAQAKQGKNGAYTAHTVCYSAAMSLRVRCQHGTWLGPWEDAATGEAKNQPSRGDAHDLALKTSVSQALKRCAKDLGDQFGLSLYAEGSTSALVRRTLVMPDAEAGDGTAAVDAHITEQLPREDEAAEPQPDPRTTSQPPVTQPPAAPTAAEPSAEDAAEKEQERRQQAADEIRAKAVGERPEGYRSPAKWIAHLMGEAVKAGVLDVPVESLLSPTTVKLKVFLEQVLKQQTAPEVRERSA